MAIDLQYEANRAFAALNQGQFKTALKIAKSLSRSHPNEPYFHNLSGLALVRMGKEREAIPHFQKAMAKDANFLEAPRNLAQALFTLGMIDKCQTMLNRLLAKHQDDGDALYLLALCQTQLGEFATAEATATRALETKTNPARALNLRGIIHQNQDNLTAAADDFRAALAINPDNPETLSNYSFVLSLTSRFDQAIAALEHALSIAPDHIGTLHRYAGLLSEMGRTGDSIATYQRILALDATHADALAGLAGLQSREENAALLGRLTSAFNAAPKTALARANLGFALWTVHKQAGALPEAEKYLVLANKCAAALRPYDIDVAIGHQNQVFTHFPADQTPPQNSDDPGPVPIFVLGLIRSGTTLTEQIISAHSGVFGAGELAIAGFEVGKFLKSGAALSAKTAHQMAQDYRAQLPQMPAGTIAFTDKMPGNYRLIGFLLAAFPGCKIINLVRDPRDTALSAFSNNFPSPGLNYTYDLKTIAQQFNLYRSTMNRWHAQYPGRILDLKYSDMVRDVATTSRALAEFCGLEYQEAMAMPDKNLRPVMTASVQQVRQGVHTKSLAGWKRHAPMLQPLIDTLDPALWPEITED